MDTEKKVLIVVTILFAAVIGWIGIPFFQAEAGITGTKHDLSQLTGGGYWTGSSDQVCIFCHTPHNASSTQTPLWNRQETQETFLAYDSPTFDGENYFADQVGHQPRGDSKLCLSCHDGITALNSLLYSFEGPINMLGGFDQLGDVYYPGSPYSGDMGPNIGENFPGSGGSGYTVNNLSNDHPISFAFNNALILDDAHGGDAQLRLPPNGDAVKLYGVNQDQLECSSCHDVHDDSYGSFLVKPNTGSSICLTCHIK
ncbi:doubled CXXCH motif [bacterium BMS3Bbin04]|nr:doubled CXXCH motif [bacterium BMS3Bbin04]